MKRFVATLIFFQIISISIFAQKNDTIRITSANINTSVLREGTHRYLVYFKMNKDSVRTQTQFWTRQIKKIDYNGIPAIEILQQWEDKDSIMHLVNSVSDAKTFKPLYHKIWWKTQTSRNSLTKSVTTAYVDFLTKNVNYNGNMLSDADTAKQAKAVWMGYKSSVDQDFFNWHLDLETFPILLYKQGAIFEIPFYDPATASSFQKVIYSVTGSAQLEGFNDQKIDCWLLVHESKGNKETFWVSKKTKEVLKLEQVLNDRFYRIKIKLGFSN